MFLSLTVPRLLPVLLATLLAACAADLAEEDYHLGHPVIVEQHHLLAQFDIPKAAEPLSAFDQDRLRRMAGESVRHGAGDVTIVSRDAGFAQSLAADLRLYGVAAPVNVKEVSVKEVNLGEGGGAARETAIIDVPIWIAQLPECGHFERGFNPDPDNTPNSNWGCALQRNLAAMVQNPADLLRARNPSGRDGNRAVDLLDKYQRGVATGSAPENITTGTTSTVGH